MTEKQPQPTIRQSGDESDAKKQPSANPTNRPGPAPLNSGDGDQDDDNVDDMGNKKGGGKLEQPT